MVGVQAARRSPSIWLSQGPIWFQLVKIRVTTHSKRLLFFDRRRHLRLRLGMPAAAAPLPPRLLLLRFQFGFVLCYEGADLVGHAKQFDPLFFVEGDGEASEPVDRHAALFADFESGAPSALVFQLFVFGFEPFQFGFEVVVRHPPIVLAGRDDVRGV
jgi:hypothetical protein